MFVWLRLCLLSLVQPTHPDPSLLYLPFHAMPRPLCAFGKNNKCKRKQENEGKSNMNSSSPYLLQLLLPLLPLLLLSLLCKPFPFITSCPSIQSIALARTQYGRGIWMDMDSTGVTTLDEDAAVAGAGVDAGRSQKGSWSWRKRNCKQE